MTAWVDTFTRSKSQGAGKSKELVKVIATIIILTMEKRFKGQLHNAPHNKQSTVNNCYAHLIGLTN